MSQQVPAQTQVKEPKEPKAMKETKEKAVMVQTLEGRVYDWTLVDKTRQYSVLNLPFGIVRELIYPVRYNAVKGVGQQRDIVESHARKLLREMEAGNYTPTPIAAGLSKAQKESVKVVNGNFSLKVSSDDPLLQDDGGHRTEALIRLRKKYSEIVADKKVNEKSREQAQRYITQIDNLPVSVTLYLDGNPQTDFVNLQAGRAVDSSHMLSLRIQRKLLDDDDLKMAFEAAKLLHKNEVSPFHNLIRFDSRGKLPLPISSLCARGASDIGTSLIGLARVAADIGTDSAWCAETIVALWRILKREDTLVEQGKVLAGDSGSKGAAGMLVGVSTCLGYLATRNGGTKPDEAHLKRVVETCKDYLDETVAGNFSGPHKRQLLGAFARNLFSGTDLTCHEGIPVDLIDLLSASTFAVTPLPKRNKNGNTTETEVETEAVA